jgi:hypothetical protein
MHIHIVLPPPPIVIPYENDDELTHLPPYFFCRVASCPCHVDKELTSILQAMIDAKEISPARALQIYWDMQP